MIPRLLVVPINAVDFWKTYTIDQSNLKTRATTAFYFFACVFLMIYIKRTISILNTFLMMLVQHKVVGKRWGCSFSPADLKGYTVSQHIHTTNSSWKSFQMDEKEATSNFFPFKGIITLFQTISRVTLGPSNNGSSLKQLIMCRTTLSWHRTPNLCLKIWTTSEQENKQLQ